MNEREFCYWLQGLLEIGGVRPLDANEVQIIRDHLALVFSKQTPERKGARPVSPSPTPPNYDYFPALPWQPPDVPGLPPYRITCAVGTPADNRTIAIC